MKTTLSIPGQNKEPRSLRKPRQHRKPAVRPRPARSLFVRVPRHGSFPNSMKSLLPSTIRVLLNT